MTVLRLLLLAALIVAALEVVPNLNLYEPSFRVAATSAIVSVAGVVIFWDDLIRKR